MLIINLFFQLNQPQLTRTTNKIKGFNSQNLGVPTPFKAHNLGRGVVSKWERFILHKPHGPDVNWQAILTHRFVEHPSVRLIFSHHKSYITQRYTHGIRIPNSQWRGLRVNHCATIAFFGRNFSTALLSDTFTFRISKLHGRTSLHPHGVKQGKVG